MSIQSPYPWFVLLCVTRTVDKQALKPTSFINRKMRKVVGIRCLAAKFFCLCCSVAKFVKVILTLLARVTVDPQ